MRTRNLPLNLRTPTYGFRTASKAVVVKVNGVLSFFMKSASYLVTIISNTLKKLMGFFGKSNIKRTGTSNISNIRRDSKFNFKKLLVPIAAASVLVIIIYVIQGVLISDETSSKSDEIKIEDAKATQDIYKEFNFPLRNSEGEDLSSINYVVEKVELRDEIIVKGKRATAIQGRTFLILILKIANEYDKAININTRDYVRLSVNGNYEEWLAPDIHNDPVEIQAISTKFTRVGFPINDSDDNLVLRVGEIEGDKEEIILSL
jgi:hypothetical protein